jgi:hypothetical protein
VKAGGDRPVVAAREQGGGEGGLTSAMDVICKNDKV